MAPTLAPQCTTRHYYGQTTPRNYWLQHHGCEILYNIDHERRKKTFTNRVWTHRALARTPATRNLTLEPDATGRTTHASRAACSAYNNNPSRPPVLAGLTARTYANDWARNAT
eukprot:8423924-Lingulodinium_polyedra.AAC.1